MSGPQVPRIGFSAGGGQLYLTFNGTATHRSSLEAEQLVTEYVLAEAGQSASVLVLDLYGCAWIDSTFAGWMVRAYQTMSSRGGRVVLSRCSNACRSSLQVMGLANLFAFEAVPPPADVKFVACPEEGTDQNTLSFLLAAHELLADVDSENQEAFARVAEALRRELEKKGHH